jgi:hypothetical protein
MQSASVSSIAIILFIGKSLLKVVRPYGRITAPDCFILFPYSFPKRAFPALMENLCFADGKAKKAKMTKKLKNTP